MKIVMIICVSVGLLVNASVSGQVIPADTSADENTVDSTGINAVPDPSAPKAILLEDTSVDPYNQPSDTVPSYAPETDSAKQVKPPMATPQRKEQNYGTITEIKKLEEYNPKETLTSLKGGNFGKPIDYKKDSIKWKKGALFGLDVNQGTLTNWAAGGDHFSLSLRTRANLYANYSDGRNSWDNNIDMSLGFLKSSSQGMRKSDDKLELYSKYSYRFSKRWFFSVLVNFKSQFANGYNYPDDSSVVSHFLAPGYVLGSVGLSYEPNDAFSVLLSPLTSRFVIVNDRLLANDGAYGVDKAVYDTIDTDYLYMVTPGKRLNYELGAYMSMIFKKEILKNIVWNTRLELYANYLENPKNIDITWNSLLTCKVNKFISASLTTELIYDDNVKYITYAKNEDGSIKTDPFSGEKVILSKGPRIQFKELIGLGFAYEF